MSNNKPNIMEMVEKLEGVHHRYPVGTAKKLKKVKLNQTQINNILFHYHNAFNNGDFKNKDITSIKYE